MDRFSDEQLQAYLDGDPTHRAAIEAALPTDAALRAQLEAYQDVMHCLKDDDGIMLSADFTDRVIARIDPASERQFNLLENGIILLTIVVGVFSIGFFLQPWPFLAGLAPQAGEWGDKGRGDGEGVIDGA